MNLDYEKSAKILKALADPNRLRIIELLSQGELCACKILESFDFTQPTLSHHMKVLSECGLINVRKEGLWNNYSLNINNCNRLSLSLMSLITNMKETQDSEECNCK